MGLMAAYYNHIMNPNSAKNGIADINNLKNINSTAIKNAVKSDLKSGNTTDLVDLTNKTDVDEAAKNFNELNNTQKNNLIGNLLDDIRGSLIEHFNKMKEKANAENDVENKFAFGADNEAIKEKVDNNVKNGFALGADDEKAPDDVVKNDVENNFAFGADAEAVKEKVDNNIKNDFAFGTEDVDAKEKEIADKINTLQDELQAAINAEGKAGDVDAKEKEVADKIDTLQDEVQAEMNAKGKADGVDAKEKEMADKINTLQDELQAAINAEGKTDVEKAEEKSESKIENLQQEVDAAKLKQTLRNNIRNNFFLKG